MGVPEKKTFTLLHGNDNIKTGFLQYFWMKFHNLLRFFFYLLFLFFACLCLLLVH